MDVEEDLSRKKAALLQWLDGLFLGPYDETYLERRCQVGLAHIKGGLPQPFAFLAMSHMQSQLEEAILLDDSSPVHLAQRGIAALHKVLDLDLALLLASASHEESLSCLSDMMTIVAHEVKNPITGISGAVQIMAKQLPPESSGRAMVEEVLQQLESLNGQVNDLLLYAKPLELQVSSVPVLSLVEETIARSIEDGSLRHAAAKTSGSEVFVQGDAELLRTAFWNVLVNAAQAQKGGGTISVMVDGLGDLARLRVIDSGPGIPAKLRGKVFGPFFSTKHNGTGLGLAITRRILEAHGGRIELSFPGEGGTTASLFIKTSRSEGDRRIAATLPQGGDG